MAPCSSASESLSLVPKPWVSRIMGLHWHNRRERVLGPRGGADLDLSNCASLKAGLIFSLLNKKRSHPFSCLPLLADCGITSGELTPSSLLMTSTAELAACPRVLTCSPLLPTVSYQQGVLSATVLYEILLGKATLYAVLVSTLVLMAMVRNGQVDHTGEVTCGTQDTKIQGLKGSSRTRGEQ